MARRGAGARVGTASVLVVGLPVVLVLGGCGADVERRQAARAAGEFEVTATSDPAAACRLLAPRTVEALETEGGCASALGDAGLSAPGELLGVTVAGHSAQARFADDTVFLALFDRGWRVTAAGCSRRSSDPAQPYDCAVEGH